MRKRLISIFILTAYAAILIKVMIFKDIPTVRIGQLMLNFGGTYEINPANFIPFTTIVPYLLGHKGLIIAGVNLLGNIVPLVPLGFLLPLVYPNITWKKSLALGIVTCLSIEILQTVLRVGIFDIDDVILNVIGVMIGYFAFVILAKWIRAKKYIHMLIAAIVIIAAAFAAFAVVYPWGQPLQNPRAGGVQSERSGQEGETLQSGDLCGGTGGNGEIVSVGDNTFTLDLGEGSDLIVNLTNEATIETSAGFGSMSDLKVGDRVTLIGGPNPDSSFTADAVVVCSSTGYPDTPQT
jgi:glycopeptide antibiotics resistance protein